MNGILTLKQASDKLQITPEVVRRWLRNGKLIGFKAGKLWRIKEDDLEAFIDKNRGDKLS